MALIKINNKEVEIEDDCIDLVLYFNEVGLKTYMCCDGHDRQNFRIIFDDSVSDNDIFDFLKDKTNKYNHSMFLGKFVKWARIISGETKLSWMYIAERKTFAKIDYQKLAKDDKNE